MTRPLRCFIVLFALAATMLLTAATPAHAQSDYGAWFPAPGQFGKEDPRLYRADIQPFSSPDVKELTNFTCLGPNGYPIPNAHQQVLAGIFKDAVDAYHGRLKGKDDKKSDYAEGPQGMKKFLADSKRLLAAGGWVRFREEEESGLVDYDKWHGKYVEQHQKIVDKQAEINSNESERARNLAEEKRLADRGVPATDPRRKALRDERVELAEKREDLDGELEELNEDLDGVLPPQSALAGFIDATVNEPINVAHKVPEGCGLNPLDVEDVSFLQIVDDTPGFFSDLVIALASKPVREGYNFLQPYAFVYTFWTPHTERGDTMFNTATSCARIPNGEQNAPNTIAGSRADIRNACSSGEALGFDKRRDSERELKKKVPWYISAAIFLQWLVSGFYFIILFAAAVLYMVRGNRNTQLNVLRLIPKLLLSALLTMFAPFIIGALISFSNVFVTTMFDFDSARSVGRINDILAQSDSIVTLGGDFIGRIVKVIVGAFTVFYFAFFVLGSLVRQLALIGLVVLAPAACFCLLVPRWQMQFNRYVRALLAVIFAPAAMAFILKLGMSLNPIIVSEGRVSDITALIGMLLMVVTLWAMTKVLKVSAAVATGNQNLMKSLTGRAMGTIGQMASVAGIASGNPALAGAGRALGAGAAVAGAAEGVGANLVPRGKGMTGMGGGMLGSGGGLGAGAGGGRRSLGSGSGSGSLLGLPSAGGSGFGGGFGGSGSGRRSFGQAFNDWASEKQAERGEQRVSHRMAMNYKRDANQALASKEQELGRRLNRQERDEFFNGAFVKDDTGRIVIDDATGQAQRVDGSGYYEQHGKLDKRRGNYYLTDAQSVDQPPERPRSRFHPVSVAQGAADNASALAQKTEAGRRAADALSSAGAQANAARADVNARKAEVLHGRDNVVRGNPAAVEEQQRVNRRLAAETAAVAADAESPYREDAQAALGDLSFCPRCGGPQKDGKCLTPTCTPTGEASPRRRNRSNVSADIDALADELELRGSAG